MGLGAEIFNFIGALVRWIYGMSWRTIAGKKNRITSYNVCYTKLLREYNVPYGFRSKKVFNEDHLRQSMKALQNSILFSGDFERILDNVRITSYNVCYTKLLRKQISTD